MILTAYFDESGTHGDSHATIMGALLGNARQWGVFQRSLDAIKVQYGFRIFHAKDFKARAGEFRGWTDAKSVALVNDLADRVSEELMAGVTAEIPNAEYKTHYLTQGQVKKVRFDSVYGLAFRACLSHCIYECVRRLGHHRKFPETKLHIVLEAGHRNSGDADRIFYEIKTQLAAKEVPLLATFTTATKEEADPLMVSDFLAHTIFMATRDGRLIEAAHDTATPRSSSASLYHVGTDADGLARLRSDLLQRQKIKVGGQFISPALLLSDALGPILNDGEKL